MHAPEEFWITVDSILAALWKDILDFINLIL